VNNKDKERRGTKNWVCEQSVPTEGQEEKEKGIATPAQIDHTTSPAENWEGEGAEPRKGLKCGKGHIKLTKGGQKRKQANLSTKGYEKKMESRKGENGARGRGAKLLRRGEGRGRKKIFGRIA